MIPVGPLSSTVQPTKNFKGHSNENFNDVGDECLKWLDEQPPTSVVYVNFGTTGFTNFSIEMVHELALGLEGSEARFLWVLRPPPGLSAEEAEQVLPSGFEERVKGRGPITRDWAPQLQILEHRSTAAFLMQGGWNSTLETICRGDPFIAWATFADQPVNVKFAADGAKLGVMLPSQDVSTGLPLRVDRHDVEKAIRLVLSSEESNLIRKNAQNMKVAAAKAVSPKGSSSRSLMSFVKGLQIAEEYRHTELHN
ncbi:protein MpUGT26 [Marchantia polymorpha subsp. ruderalis]